MNDYSTLNQNVIKYKALQAQAVKSESELREISRKKAQIILSTLSAYQDMSTRKLAGFFGISHQAIAYYKVKFGKEVESK